MIDSVDTAIRDGARDSCIDGGCVDLEGKASEVISDKCSAVSELCIAESVGNLVGKAVGRSEEGAILVEPAENIREGERDDGWGWGKLNTGVRSVSAGTADEKGMFSVIGAGGRELGNSLLSKDIGATDGL